MADFEHTHYQFEKVIQKLNLKSDASRNPLFDVMFVLENLDYGLGPNEEQAKVKLIEPMAEVAKFDLTLTAKEAGGNLDFSLEYSSRLFNKATVQRMGEHYARLLAEAAANPDKELGGLDMLSNQEKHLLLNVFKGTPTDYPKDKTIHELFEEQADRTPDQLAVVCGGQALTYSELNEQANSLASVLREKGVGAEAIVGIMADRSLELIIAILGTLKAGGAYLPIDPEYPADRINYMLTDSQAAMLLFQHHIVKDLTYAGGRLELENSELYIRETGNPVKASLPENLAYVIYTSGTTGTPKGVMVEHRNLVNYIHWANKRYVAGEQTAFPLYSSISFDLTVTSIYTPLISGNTIVIYDGEDKALLTRTIAEENKVNIVKLTPTHLRLLEDMDLSRSSIRTFIVGGEDLKIKVAEKIHRAFDGRIEIYNEYGPTEATVGCMIYKYNAERDKGTSVSIGIPADNTQLYIVGSRMELLPVGVAGELCIGGDGVARGYLHKEALTAEKFVDHPFNAGSKLYKTGDMARWLSDGTVEYLGRMDNQVKIRGYRIETGEIENRLLQMPDITEAVVVARTDEQGHNYLCAYVVSNKEVIASEVKGRLSKELPNYMVPGFTVQIAKLPLSSNGKVDIKALPAVDISEMLAASYEAPNNKVEEILVDVWQRVLNIEPIGTNYNYYEMGGDSIKSILIVSALREHGLRLEVKDLMQYPSIKELAGYVKHEDVQAPQEAVEGSVPFLPVQQWFFEQGLPQENHYNQAFMFYRKEGLDEEILRKAVVAILVHHDALRMVYKRTPDGITQWNRSADCAGAAFTLDVYDLRGQDEKRSIPALSDELQKGLDLEEGLLVKLGLFKTSLGDHLLVAVHHLVIDGVSWRILIADLETAYRNIAAGAAASLPPKTASYRSWAQKLKEYASGKVLLKEAEYWKGITNTGSGPLPKDFGEENRGCGERMEVSLNFSKEQTAKLLRNCNTAYNTQINDVLLCSLGLAFKEWGGMDQLLVSLEGHGREEIFQGVSIDRTIGWFTTIFPVVLDMTRSHDLAYSLKRTKEMLRHVPHKGIGYGIWKYLADGNKELRAFEPEVSFNYLGEFGREAGSSLLEFSRLSSGASISIDNNKLKGIDINGLIMEGELELVFSYSTLEYTRETVAQLTAAYHTSLLQVIDHCAHRQTAEKTPWDYGDPDLSLEDLDTLLACGQEIEKIHSLSPMQEGMMYNTIVDAGSSTYFEQSELNIEGYLNVEILNMVLNELTGKYEILRTAFFYHDIKKFKQAVLKERKLRIHYEDISSRSMQEQSSYIEQFKVQDRSNPFDLEQDCLLRVAVLKTDTGNFKVVYSFHHIIMDGWSAGIILQEVIAQYKARLQEAELKQEKAVPYSDYLDWLDHQDKAAALDYWQSYLEAYESGTVIPELQHQEKGFMHQQERTSLDAQATAKLKSLAEANGITLSSVIQTAWGVVLQKYSNTHDVVFGSVVSGRPSDIKGIERMVGLCINTVPVRVTGGDQLSFIALAKKLNKDFIHANAFSFCQLAEIQALSPMKNNLINHVVVYENYPVDQSLADLQEAEGREVKITAAQGFEQTNYDLEILIAPGRTLQIKITYNGCKYSRDVINALMDNLMHVLSCAVSNPDQAAESIDMVSEQERNKLLYELNCTGTAYAKEKTIAQLFEEQAERTPEAIALEFHGTVLSYRELNKRANQLARVLRRNSVGANVIVPILVKRSLNLLVGILGILKAGGGYLPLDTDYPVDRIHYMLQDSQASLLLTEKGLAAPLGLNEAVTILDIGSKQIQDEDDSNLQSITKADDLAYVLYTSGSTGNPKGVAVEQRGVHNFIKGITDRISFTEDKIILSVTTCSFDIFGLESLLPLTRGLKVVIASEEEQKDPHLLNKVILDSEVNTIQLTPSRLKLMLNCSNTAESFKKLKLMMIGGEGFPKDLLVQLQKFTDSRIYNMYGPTETTIWSTVKELTHENSVNVGKPIANTQVYIVDQAGHLAPIGVAGELCIAGDGVARGYLHKEELTASKFVDNPFMQGTKMYTTGDLARWLPNGELDVIGRLDNQVKIGGYRIELGEIESVAARHDKITQCVVAGQPNSLGSQDLVLYFVAAEKISTSELVNFLSPVLPKYMMPQMYIQIDEIPLTANGKTNLKALPKPGNVRPELRDDYEEAVTDLQKEIQQVWSLILNIEQVGIYDNFFEVGGNSLKIVAMYNELQKLYPGKIQITDIFSYPTISRLAQFIDNQSAFAEAAVALDHEGMAIELPAVYLAGEAEPDDGRVLRFSFAGDSYAGLVQACTRNRYEIIHLLLAGYVFLLSDICQRERLAVQFSDQAAGRFGWIEADITGLDNFYEIVSLVKDQHKHLLESPRYTVQSDLEMFRTGSGSTVVPLFSRVNDSHPAADHEDDDLVLEAAEKAGEIEIVWRYNRSKLKQAKMYELFNQYIKLLQVIIESGERTSSEVEV
ncbi:non-ribosomal peptide synthetase [Paenibacillus riograndensis]|uniref:non-ribosomal peptide synthetase n=1 Tax=Paenibacillus riograndensis TaxID=483937 RepID=UPI000303EAD0|nr:non-ribosomal peptide synthetase [Paenibacillus riograndensis]